MFVEHNCLIARKIPTFCAAGAAAVTFRCSAGDAGFASILHIGDGKPPAQPTRNINTRPRAEHKAKVFRNIVIAELCNIFTSLVFRNGVAIEINNYGTRVFSRRAVLRIGMLMPGSKVATEVRTQLLNVFEKVPATIVVEDIDREVELRRRVGECLVEGRYAEASDYTFLLTKYLDKSKETAFID